MNKPERFMAELHPNAPIYDDCQLKLTRDMRAAEGAIVAALALAEQIKTSHPGLFGAVQAAYKEVCELHLCLSGHQKQLMSDGMLSKPHAECSMNWLDAGGAWTDQVPTDEERTLRHCK